MRNLFTFLFCLFATVLTVKGQTTLFEDDFQTAGFPAGYTMQDVDGNTPKQTVFSKAWNRLQFSNAQGDMFIASTSDYTPAGTADDWVITKQIQLTASTDNSLFYSVRNANTKNTSETYEVLISTTTTSLNSFTVIKAETSTPTAWTNERIVLDSYAGQKVYLAFRNTTTAGSIIAIDNIQVISNMPRNNAALTEITTVAKLKENTTADVKGLITYKGVDTLTSVDVNWTVNGGTTHTQSLNNLNLKFNETINFNHTDKYTSTTAGNMDELIVWLSNTNGGVDGNPSNDTLKKEVMVINGKTVKRNPLFEEFTTSICQFCPDGHRVASLMANQFPRMITVNLHSCFGTDSMTNAEASAICTAIGSGSAPSGMVDRLLLDGEGTPAFGRGTWVSQMSSRYGVGSPVDLIFDGSYDTTSRKVNYTVKAKFVDYVVPGDIRLSLIIVENNLSGSGRGWDQVNYYNTDPNSPFYKKGNPIRGYVHQHVMREIKPSTWGDATVIPSTLTLNTEYSKNFNFTLSNAYKAKDVSLVAVLSYKGVTLAGYEVLNSKQIYLMDQPSGIEKLTEGVSQLDVYPNPSADKTNIGIKLTENTAVNLVLRDITGKVVYENNYGEMAKGSHVLPINVASFSNGFYFVDLTVGGAKLTRKIIVNH